MDFNEYVQKAKQYVRKYYDDEFCLKDEILDAEIDSLNIREIPMGYTTVTDDEIEIQCYVDLKTMVFWREVNLNGEYERLDLTVFGTQDLMLDFLDDFNFTEVYCVSGCKLGDAWAVYEDKYGYTKEWIYRGKEWEGDKE